MTLQETGMLTGVLLSLIVLQSIAIWALARNRRRHKHALASVRETLALLEQRLSARTDAWRHANDTLEQAEQRHRITTALLNETKEYLNSIINPLELCCRTGHRHTRKESPRIQAAGSLSGSSGSTGNDRRGHFPERAADARKHQA